MTGAGAAQQSLPPTPLPSCVASLMHHFCTQGAASAEAAWQLPITAHGGGCGQQGIAQSWHRVGRVSWPCMSTILTRWRREVQAASILALAGLQQQGCGHNENMGSTVLGFCAPLELTVEVAPSWKGVKGASGDVNPAGTCFRGVPCCMAASSIQSCRSSQKGEWRELLTFSSLGYVTQSDSLAFRVNGSLDAQTGLIQQLSHAHVHELTGPTNHIKLGANARNLCTSWQRSMTTRLPRQWNTARWPPFAAKEQGHSKSLSWGCLLYNCCSS